MKKKINKEKLKRTKMELHHGNLYMSKLCKDFPELREDYDTYMGDGQRSARAYFLHFVVLALTFVAVMGGMMLDFAGFYGMAIMFAISAMQQYCNANAAYVESRFSLRDFFEHADEAVAMKSLKDAEKAALKAMEKKNEAKR